MHVSVNMNSARIIDTRSDCDSYYIHERIYSTNSADRGRDIRLTHMCFLAINKDSRKTVCLHRNIPNYPNGFPWHLHMNRRMDFEQRLTEIHTNPCILQFAFSQHLHATAADSTLYRKPIILFIENSHCWFSFFQSSHSRLCLGLNQVRWFEAQQRTKYRKKCS